MDLRRHSYRLVALAVVVSLPLLGMSGVASAKVKAKGCHKTHSCKGGGASGSGTGSGAVPAPMTIQIDPNPEVETAQSDVLFTVQVETSPSFAGDDVTISSSQLAASCSPVDFGFFAFDKVGSGFDSVVVPLDDDGNTTVSFSAQDCAPGSSLFEADLNVAPYDTALTTFTAEPPVVTAPGVFGSPTTSGIVTGGEVETGDTGPAFAQSDIYAVFYVETNPVYAEQTVEISSSQLQARCGDTWELESVSSTVGGGGNVSFGSGSVLGPGSSTTATATLDDDGNAAFAFLGASCATGPSVVTADVEAGTHPTYTTTFDVLPPQPTI